MKCVFEYSGGIMLVHDHLQMKTRVIDFLSDIPRKYDPKQRVSQIGNCPPVNGKNMRSHNLTFFFFAVKILADY